MDSWKVTALDKQGNLLASYIFDDMSEAMKFHAGMVAKGYESVMERIFVK
jgi:hypothetical protein